MKAKLNDADSFDLDVADPDGRLLDGAVISLYIGSEGGVGADQFDVEVWKLDVLADRFENEVAILPRGVILTNLTRTADLMRVLRNQIDGVSGSDWSALSEKLSHMYRSEYGPFF
jgi:hypothetical protein